MSIHDIFTLYIFFVGLLSGVGLLYLLYSEIFVVGYRDFLILTTLGLFMFAVVGPLFELFYPSLVHIIHTIAALLVIFGLYNPVHNDLRKEEWAELLLKEPRNMRTPADWMVPMDDEILELFHSSHLVLTPSIIAYNIDYSREEVNRRLSDLEEHHLVEKVDYGKYTITDVGERYLGGEAHSALLEVDDNKGSKENSAEAFL